MGLREEFDQGMKECINTGHKITWVEWVEKVGVEINGQIVVSSSSPICPYCLCHYQAVENKKDGSVIDRYFKHTPTSARPDFDAAW